MQEPPTSLSSEPTGAGRIGPYHLLQKIGEGGMGEVWLAEQHGPIHRQVAVKIIKLGMDTREVVARFETERQALAMMDHPGIARVFDGGSTPEGRPFFVMEYVPGIPLTDHCDRIRLGINGRLKLFLQVCRAVQHAHHKAVIHRDLKPSNVLVAIQGDEAVPKIIDFGIAKATTQRLTEKTMFTQLGMAIGTPEYMSPEQAEITGQDVDTRTDVYSLGVILYELLTGARPIDLRESSDSGFDEVRRRIRDEQPPKPSTRTRALGPGLSDIAGRRQSSAVSLPRQLAGDLDWITMKALEKDRTRRYGSPSELAADIERHLAGQPVSAHPPSAGYRARRFIRRHRFGAAVAAAAIVGLILFAVTMAVLAGRIAQERDRANDQAQAKERIAEFLKELFSVSDPSRARGNTITAREILDQGVKRIDETLKDQPDARADLMGTMGDVYTSLGLYAEAERLAREALDVRRGLVGDHGPAVMETSRKLAWLMSLQGHDDQAEELLERVVTQSRSAFGEDDKRTLIAKSHLATVLANLSARGLRSYDTTLALFLDTAAAQRRVLGDDHDETLSTLNNLAGLYFRHGDVARAAGLFEEILERRRRTYGETHPRTLSSMNNLATAYQSAGRFGEAKKLLARAISLAEKVLGPNHPDYGTPVHTMGELAMTTGDLVTAEAHLMRALAVYKQQPAHRFRGLVLYQLAAVTARMGQVERSLDFLASALAEGYRPEGPSGLADDPGFSALHGNPRFEAMAAQTRQPAVTK